MTDKPEDRWHREAFAVAEVPDGTYELVGPKVQGNPDRFVGHRLVPHGQEEIKFVPRDFEGLKRFFEQNDIEGIVWWHEDGRMVKIKGKDFGIKRKKAQS